MLMKKARIWTGNGTGLWGPAPTKLQGSGWQIRRVSLWTAYVVTRLVLSISYKDTFCDITPEESLYYLLTKQDIHVLGAESSFCSWLGSTTVPVVCTLRWAIPAIGSLPPSALKPWIMSHTEDHFHLHQSCNRECCCTSSQCQCFT